MRKLEFCRVRPAFWAGVAFTVLGLSTQSPARADAAPLSLEEAIGLAIRTAPQVLSATATLEARKDVAPSAGRLPDPQLITGVENVPIDTADRFSLTRDFMTMRKVGLMQSFPNREKRRLQAEQAERAIDVAQAQLQKSRFDTARAAAEDWIALAVGEQRLVRLRELKPETDLQAAAARAALASGRASAAEVLNVQTLAARLDEHLLAFEQDVQMKRAEFTRCAVMLAGELIARLGELSRKLMSQASAAILEQLSSFSAASCSRSTTVLCWAFSSGN